MYLNEFKFIVIGDLHIGKISKYFTNNSEKLLDEYFDNLILFCKNNGIQTIMQLGDIFDVNTPSQKDINYFIRVLQNFDNNGIAFYAITGNHDYKYNSDLKSTGTIEQLIKLNKFNNIHIYSQSKVEYINEFPFYFLPFPDYQISEEINKCVCLLHIDINTYKHINCEIATDIKNGVSLDNFNNNNLYLCGHIHTKQYNKNIPNIYYVGTPYQTSFSEVKKDGSPEIKSIQLVTLTKKESDFEYDIKEVCLHSTFNLTTLYIENENDFDKVRNYSVVNDRLTLKIKNDNISVPLSIQNDERIYKITGNLNNKENEIDIENIFEDYTDDNLKEDIIKYMQEKKYDNIDYDKLIGTFKNIWMLV